MTTTETTTPSLLTRAANAWRTHGPGATDTARRIVPLPDGHLADAITGEPVRADADTETVTLTAYGRLPRDDAERDAQAVAAMLASHRPERHATPTETTLAVGPLYATLRTQAEAFVAEWPGVRASLGDLATDHVTAALTVLHVLARDWPPITTSADALRVVERLVPHGREMAWGRQYVGVLAADADPEACAAYPFAHVTDEVRDGARREYAALLAEAALPTTLTVECPAPEGTPGACLLCGVRQVETARVDAERAWTWHAGFRAYALGGAGPDPVPGYVCRDCERALTDAGAIGPTAFATALARSRGVTSPIDLDRLRVRGLRAWAVTGRREPNTVPWGHVARADAVAEALRTGVVVDDVEAPAEPEGLRSEVDDLRAEVAALRAALAQVRGGGEGGAR